MATFIPGEKVLFLTKMYKVCIKDLRKDFRGVYKKINRNCHEFYKSLKSRYLYQQASTGGNGIL